jgi:hypothetical protein
MGGDFSEILTLYTSNIPYTLQCIPWGSYIFNLLPRGVYIEGVYIAGVYNARNTLSVQAKKIFSLIDPLTFADLQRVKKDAYYDWILVVFTAYRLTWATEFDQILPTCSNISCV